AARHPAKNFFMVLLIYAECFWSRVPRAPKKAFAHRSTSCSMTWLYIADMRSFIASGLFFKHQVACNMAFLMSSILIGLHKCAWVNSSAATANLDMTNAQEKSACVATISCATKFML